VEDPAVAGSGTLGTGQINTQEPCKGETVFRIEGLCFPYRGWATEEIGREQPAGSDCRLPPFGVGIGHRQ
jgi:hypothetical protein